MLLEGKQNNFAKFFGVAAMMRCAWRTFSECVSA